MLDKTALCRSTRVDMSVTDPIYTVATAIRNEGPFLLEWIAWQRMLGFTQIVVASNDCTDRSVELLTLLAAAGLLIHIAHDPADGQPPLQSARRALRNHPAIVATTWLMLCDIDEFLVIHRGRGRLDELLARTPSGIAAMAFHWRCFGSGGRERWSDGLVHRQFKRCAPASAPINTSFKTVFRDPGRFGVFGAHSPRDFDGDWTAEQRVMVRADGTPLVRYHPNNRPQKATAPAMIDHSVAQLNHYVVRSAEEYAAKRGTLSGSALHDRYTDDFRQRHDRNDDADQSALARPDAFRTAYRVVCAVPGALALHHLCCADRVVALRGSVSSARQDERYLYHLDAARSLGRS